MGSQQAAKATTTESTMRITLFLFLALSAEALPPPGASLFHNLCSMTEYKPMMSSSGKQ